MGDFCDLHAANGDPDVECDETECPFWRVVDHVSEAQGEGCAIKYYELLGEDSLAVWLLSVKQRIELLESRDCSESDG